MKKLYSLIKACMTSDMALFKIKKKNKFSSFIPIIIALYLMFMIWGVASSTFEKLSPYRIQYILLPLAAFSVSILTIIEGIYKSGPLLFNCKDDQLLFSLPIKKTTILFVRILKFYIFELLFNSLFLLSFMIAYIRWAIDLNWTYLITSIIMLLTLPIIPIIISCVIGVITTSISSRFKYKKLMQVILSMTIVIGIMVVSYKMDNLLNYILEHANSLNDFITKIYYPAGVYAKLIVEFNVSDLIVYLLVNIGIFTISILLLSKSYFEINSRTKKVTTTKKSKIKELTIKSRNQTVSLIKKELGTFLKTPVFIINAGFALVLFIIGTILISIKFDSAVNIITQENIMNITSEMITNNLSIFILILIVITSFMTSITSSVISLEGKSINILKSLPISTKTILLSKIYAALLITTPVLLIGDMILFIRFKINIIESLLLVVLSILMPLVSHFIGILINLKYPKLDAESDAEVVKQSTSSFISVTFGMAILITNFVIIVKTIGIINPILLLIMLVITYLVINIILYSLLITKGTKNFNNLSI